MIDPTIIVIIVVAAAATIHSAGRRPLCRDFLGVHSRLSLSAVVHQ